MSNNNSGNLDGFYFKGWNMADKEFNSGGKRLSNESDLGDIQSEHESVNDDISEVIRLIESIQTDISRLQTVQEEMESYQHFLTELESEVEEKEEKGEDEE